MRTSSILPAKNSRSCPPRSAASRWSPPAPWSAPGSPPAPRSRTGAPSPVKARRQVRPGIDRQRRRSKGVLIAPGPGSPKPMAGCSDSKRPSGSSRPRSCRSPPASRSGSRWEHPRLERHPRGEPQRGRIRDRHLRAAPVEHERVAESSRRGPGGPIDRAVVVVTRDIATVVPAPSLKAYAATRLGGVLEVVALATLEYPLRLPAASAARTR